MSEETYHIPALLPQTINALKIKADGIYVDATYGGGGHSRGILAALGPEGHLYGFDQDRDAHANAVDDPRLTMVLSNFRYVGNFMRFYDVESIDGLLADLGVSFHHFDDAERGFSFRFDGPLDMRMNRNARMTAAELIATSSQERLAEMFHLLGELDNSRRLASAIASARAKAPINTIAQLLAVIDPLIDPRRRKQDLAKVFQALRIEVNDELGALRDLLNASIKLLRPGARLAIITYHSLEDRLVKNFMRSGNFSGNIEKDFYGRSQAPMKLITSKPIVPDEIEIAANPRSRSAKLRVAEML